MTIMDTLPLWLLAVIGIGGLVAITIG